MVCSYPTYTHEKSPTDGSFYTLSSQPERRAPVVYRARGLTLLELLIVVSIIGILSTVVIARIGFGGLGRPTVSAAARRLSLDLRHARSLAITKRANHYVRFDASGYTTYRRDTPTDVAVEVRRVFPQGVTAALTASDFEFEPTGAALDTFRCDLSGSGVTYRVKVHAVTGVTVVRKL